MFRAIIPLLLVCLLLTGCNQSTLSPTTPTRVIVDNVEYSLLPYTPILHEQLRIDPLLSDLGLSTSFILTVRNLNPNPIKTNLFESIVIQDQTHRQFRPVKSASLFVHDLTAKAQEMTPIQVHELEMSIQYQMEQPVTTQNIEYYSIQLTELKRKVSQVEQQQRIQQELTQREHAFKENLNVYGFRDQMLFPQGEHQGLVVFPPLTGAQSTSVTVLMLAGNNQTISFSYTLVP